MWIIPISLDRNSRADWFQIVCDCLIVSIVNNQ